MQIRGLVLPVRVEGLKFFATPLVNDQSLVQMCDSSWSLFPKQDVKFAASTHSGSTRIAWSPKEK